MGLKTRITREFLKEKVGDRNIFDFYFAHPIEIGKSYCSVFREEVRPSTGFFISDNGSLIYGDFATGDKYDFVAFVQKLYGLSYYKAVNMIAIDFGLIPGERSTNREPVIKPITGYKERIKKKFTINTIPFKKHHLAYWAQYGITRQELIANNIKAVGKVKIDDFTIPEAALRFLYVFKDDKGEKYFKLYTPESLDYKWVSSVPLDIPFGIKDLTYTGDTLIITKSVKDCLVLRKFFPEVIGLQNEGKGSINKETIAALKRCYKHIYIWFDLDRTGLKASNYFMKKYGFKPIFTLANFKPNIFRALINTKQKNVKDPADFVKRYGIATFAQYLKHINLLPINENLARQTHHT